MLNARNAYKVNSDCADVAIQVRIILISTNTRNESAAIQPLVTTRTPILLINKD